jgi:hypothetical protein
MKKALLIIGWFVLFTITTGTMFKLMHWPGAGPMLVVGITFFCAIYLPLFFIERMISGKTGLNAVVNTLGLISTEAIFTGVMFKIMHWPGAGPMIVLGCLCFMLPATILYIIQQFKEYDRKFREFGRLVIMSLLACVFLIFWGSNVTSNILRGFLSLEDNMIEANESVKRCNSFMLVELGRTDSTGAYPVAQKIDVQTMEMILFVDEMKKALVTRVDMDPASIDNHWNIGGIDNYDIPTYYMGKSGPELWENLYTYKRQCAEELKNLNVNNQEIMSGLESRINQGDFYQQTVAGALALLTGVQNDILNNEFKCLSAILGQKK